MLTPVLVVNQTADTLQSLTLELATLGDLKLTEKPSVHTIGPHDFCSITANVKVPAAQCTHLCTRHLASSHLDARCSEFHIYPASHLSLSAHPCPCPFPSASC